MAEAIRWSELALPLQRAALAVGALDGRLAGHPLREAWTLRAMLEAAIAATLAGGRKADRDRMLALLIGLPINLDKEDWPEGDALRHLEVIRALSGAELPQGGAAAAPMDAPPAPAMSCVQAIRDRSEGVPGLAAAGLGVRACVMAGEAEGSCHAAVPAALRDLGVVGHYLPGVSAVPRGEPDATRWLAGFLAGVADAAVRGRCDLDTLALAWGLWVKRLGKPRKDSSYLRVLALAAAVPALTPAYVAAVTGLTLRGASLVLERLASLGILAEVSGRRSWHLYVAEDLAGVGAARRPAPAVVPLPPPTTLRPLPPPSEKLPPPPDIDLSAIYANLDRAMSNSKAAMDNVLRAQEAARRAEGDREDEDDEP